MSKFTPAMVTGVGAASAPVESRMSSLGKKAGLAMGVAAAAGAVIFAKKAVSLEAEFSKTMNKFQASTDLPAAGMKRMQDLALKMGADTVFSASEASDAMLAMAKSGLKPATIEAGGLNAALTLAAAGELEMGTAAEVMSNALNTFSLKGKDAAAVSAALAGAANASSASVESLAQGLQQVGTVAADAGFTVQETTGAMAALANAGIAGSDAGTSLKTMLANLVPTTKAAYKAFQAYGLVTYDANAAAKVLANDGIKVVGKSYEDTYKAVEKHLIQQGVAEEGTAALVTATEDYLQVTGVMRNAFLKSNGDFKSLGSIAGTLKEKLDGLSDSERGTALSAMFGTDARRAATVLMKEGERGLAKYVKASSDAGAAEKMAAAGMKGTAGAIEQLKGSLETVTLQFGLFIAPAVQAGLKTLTGMVNALPGIFDRISGALSGGGGLSGFGEQVAQTAGSVKDFAMDLMPTILDVGAKIGGAFALVAPLIRDTLLPAFEKMLPIIKPVAKFLLEMFGSAVVGFIKGVVQAVKGFVDVITGTVDLFKALITGDWSGAWDAVKKIATGVLDFVVGAIKAWFNFGILAIFKAGLKKVLGSWNGLWTSLKSAGTKALTGIKTLIAKAWEGLKALFSKALGAIGKVVVSAIKGYWSLWKGLFKTVKDIAVLGWKVVREAFATAFAAVRVAVSAVISKVTDAWKGLFTKVKDVAKSGWDIVRGVFSSAFTKIKDGFKLLVSGVGRIWDRLKGIVMAPVRFVIDTVINKGLIDGFNKISEKVNGPTLARLAVPGGAALVGQATGPSQYAGDSRGLKSGGVLPGWTPGRDVHHFTSPTAGRLHLSGGEAIMRPEFTRAMGGERGIADLNRKARMGRLHGPHRDPDRAFFLGGVFPVNPGADISQHSGYPWASWAGDLNVPGDETGNPVYAWKKGTVASAGWGGADSYGNVMRLNHAGQSSLYAHLNSFIAKAGQEVAAGQLIGRVGTTGNSSGPHLHFEVKGGNVAGGYGVSGSGGGISIPGWAQDLLGSAIGSVENLINGPLNALKSKFPGNAMAGLAAGFPTTLVSSLADFLESKVTGMFGSGSSSGASVAGISGPVVSQVQQVAERYGWGSGANWDSLKALVQQESSWNPNAANPTSSARGLFQKMTSIHGAVEPTAAGQAQWGLNYIKGRYGSPVAAWNFHRANNWYKDGGVLPTFDQGGWLNPGMTGTNKSKTPEPVFTGAQWSTLKAAVNPTLLAARGERSSMKGLVIQGRLAIDERGEGMIRAVVKDEIRENIRHVQRQGGR